MASKRLCVRLLSGATVYEGPRPRSLAELRDEVAAALGCGERNELSFCSGDAVLACIEDADEQITIVRENVMGLLGEFMKYMRREVLPEHLWPAREHRRLLLSALAHDSFALQHAAPELLDDPEFVLAAVAISGHALMHVSAKVRADRAVA